MAEENEENFQTYEDDIIILLNKLSETIETFNTLSREQAENAILETNVKISNCKEILVKMEQYIKELNDEDENEKTELNKKLLNYKTEYHEILNKYNEIQENYINRKTENALMEDPNASNLVDEEENKNRTSAPGPSGAGDPYIVDGELNDSTKKNNKETKKESENKEEKKEEEVKSNNNISNKNQNKNTNEITLISVTNDNLQNNDSYVIGYALNANKEKEETFHQINKDYDKKKKQTVIICVFLCIFVFFLIMLFAILSS